MPYNAYRLESWMPADGDGPALYQKEWLTRTWGQLVEVRVAGLGSRGRPNLRGYKVDRDALALIDGTLCDLWEREGPKPDPVMRLWKLNCLMYSGKAW